MNKGETGVSTLMIAGGGTQEWMARDKNRRVVFVGTERGLEKTIVPKAGFPLELISVGGLKGKAGLDLVGNLARLPLGFVQAWKLVGKHRPSVVLGVGGYSSGPVLVAAKLRSRPTMIHEANAFPGLTNRVVGRFTTTIAVAFKDAAERLNRKDAVVTGNPIRREFFEAAANPQPRTADQQRSLLIFGGSQGSHIINEAMSGALLFLARLKDRVRITHQTGPNELDTVRSAYKTSAFPGTRVVPYLDPIAPEIAGADLVVSRSGAMTIGELAAAGRPAILIPFAAATNNHQELNARVVERAGGAIVITEPQLTPERLALAIAEVINNPDRAGRMGAAARSLAAPEATKIIVDLLEKIEKTE
jgi:UDP-N-acetylglucosamine--N-acetylmuramyl-(pentapeptide) pyrophosphoryl-undecaprenol N-acetylglucosamine transferase